MNRERAQKGRYSPASLEAQSGTGMEPEFTLMAEQGYEQCTRRTNKEKNIYIKTSHHEGLLLLHSLEAAVTELGGGVDELQVDLLQSATVCLDEQRLQKRKNTDVSNRIRKPFPYYI